MKLTRRDFFQLSLLLATTSPSQFWQTAMAAGSRKKDFVRKKYVQIALYGAPSRWFFDSPLCLNPGEKFIKNRMVANGFGVDGSPEYLTSGYNGRNLPIQWFLNIPGISNTRQATELLPNCNIVRGVSMVAPQHPAAGQQLSAPDPGGISLSGLLADRSPYLFHNVSLGNNEVTRAYRDESGRSPLIINPKQTENLMDFLIEPFDMPSLGWAEDSFVDRVSSLFGGFEKAKGLSQEKCAEIKQEFLSARARYRNLSDLAIQKGSYPKINDRPIKGFPLSEQRYPGKLSIEEVCYDYLVDRHVYVGDDLRELTAKSFLKYWPDYFALAEVGLRHNLSNNFILSSPAEMGHMLEDLDISSMLSVDYLDLKFDKRKNETIVRSRPGYKLVSRSIDPINMDAHGYPTKVMILIKSMMYMSFASMLIEFIDFLKKTKSDTGEILFNETLIQFTSEFDRVPDNFNPISHHNDKNHISTFFSGAISEFRVMGNIEQGVNETNYCGTFGNGASNGKYGLLTYGHISNSMCEFFDLPYLVDRSPSIYEMRGGRFKGILPWGRTIG